MSGLFHVQGGLRIVLRIHNTHQISLQRLTQRQMAYRAAAPTGGMMMTRMI